MENQKRVKEGQFYWFRKSWDKKRNKESFIGNDNENKIIISDRIPEIEGEYKIDKIKKVTKNYSIVSLGERKRAVDLFSGVCLEDAVNVLKNFGFEVFVRAFEYKTGWDENDNIEIAHEHQIIAWNNEFGLFVNGGTWDSGDNFNNLTIHCPNIFGFATGNIGGLYFQSCSSNKVTIEVVNSRRNDILSFLVGELKFRKIEEGIQVSQNINGQKTYFDLNNYDMNRSTLEKLLVDCDKIYDMLPEDGKKFMDDHVFVKMN